MEKKVGDPVNVNYTRENSGDVSGSGTTLIMSLNDNTHNDKLGQVISYRMNQVKL